jgi:TusA-related sulfurtransferase
MLAGQRGQLHHHLAHFVGRAEEADAVAELIEMWTTDPSSVPDLEAFQKLTGHQVLSGERQSGAFRFLVKRAK